VIYAQIGLLATVFFEGVVSWFGEQKFQGSFDYIPFLMMTFFLRGVISAFGIGMDIAKVPHRAFYAVIPAAVTSVIMAILLIPTFGIMGAIYTLCSSLTVKALIMIFLSHKAYPRKFPLFGFVCLVVHGALVFWGIYIFRIEGVFDLVLKMIAVMVATAVPLGLMFSGSFLMIVRNVCLRKCGEYE